MHKIAAFKRSLKNVQIGSRSAHMNISRWPSMHFAIAIIFIMIISSDNQMLSCHTLTSISVDFLALDLFFLIQFFPHSFIRFGLLFCVQKQSNYILFWSTILSNFSPSFQFIKIIEYLIAFCKRFAALSKLVLFKYVISILFTAMSKSLMSHIMLEIGHLLSSSSLTPGHHNN